MKYIKLIRNPDISAVAGVKVTKDTVLEHKTDTVTQTIKDLVFHSVTKTKGENFKSKHEVTVNLKEGQYIVFDETRGYIVPAQKFVTYDEAIHTLECSKGVAEFVQNK